VGLFVASVALALGCGNDDGPAGGASQTPIDGPLPTPELVCPSYAADAHPEMVPLPSVNASPTGAIEGAFSTDSRGTDTKGTFAEYRLWPDSQVRVLGYGAPAANDFHETYFDAYLPNADEVSYGKSANARSSWRDAVTRSWQKELEVDRRGNTIRYTYASLGGGTHGTTREHVIDSMTYAGFIDDQGVETPGDTVIDFEYNDEPRYGTLFYQGDEISRRMQLVRIDMRKHGVAVRYDDDANERHHNTSSHTVAGYCKENLGRRSTHNMRSFPGVRSIFRHSRRQVVRIQAG
jgi:hypothetical protein